MNKGGNELRCGVYNRLQYYCDEMVMRLCTLMTRLKAMMQAVAVGRRCKFYGTPVFLQRRGGHITIGERCEFRSRTYSNLLGLNHKCILSATPAYKGSSARLTIGNGCGMSGVSIRCFHEITIGDNVRVGANVLIIDGDDHFDDPRVTPPLSVKIEDDVFIGANCVVKKGVTIGRGAVIGMNSVVTRDIPPYSVAVGAPARVVRFLSAGAVPSLGQ